MAEADFIQLAVETGFCEPCEVECSVITIENDAVQEKIGDLNFHSITFNLRKS